MSALAPYHGPANSPALPAEHDLGQIMRMAEAFKNSGLIPSNLRNKPDDIALVALRGLELGMSFTQSFGHLYPINGRIVAAAKLQAGLVRQAGHTIRFEESTSEHCTVVGTRRDTGEVQEATFTMADARTAKLDNQDNYKKYPADMLRARAVTRLVTMLFSDVTLGLEPTMAEMTAIEGGEVLEISVDDPLDAKAIDAAPVDSMPPPPTEPEPEAAPGPSPQAEHRNECTSIAGAMGRIPSGLWRQQWAKAWNAAGLPANAHDLRPEQLEPARHLIRQYIALAALDEIGVKAADERHAFVMAATDGATESTKQLTHEHHIAVMRAVQQVKTDLPAEPEPPPEEPPEQAAFDEEPAYSGDPF